MVDLQQYLSSFLSPDMTDVVLGVGIILVMVTFCRLITSLGKGGK